MVDWLAHFWRCLQEISGGETYSAYDPSATSTRTKYVRLKTGSGGRRHGIHTTVAKRRARTWKLMIETGDICKRPRAPYIRSTLVVGISLFPRTCRFCFINRTIGQVGQSMTNWDYNWSRVPRRHRKQAGPPKAGFKPWQGTQGCGGCFDEWGGLISTIS